GEYVDPVAVLAEKWGVTKWDESGRCLEGRGSVTSCYGFKVEYAALMNATSKGVSRQHAEAVAREAVLTLAVPDPEIMVGPDPSVNKWNMAVVGFPLWVWTESDDTVSASVTEQGITIELTAVRDKIVFDFGDGTTTTCREMTAYSRTRAGYELGDPSPTCGHMYEYPSLPDGDYTVTATASWTVQWSALGFSGTLTGESVATRDIPVGELQAILVTGER
ncbi:MAG: hypothetical protein ACK5LS_07735, partial [Propioniciclava sp.]